LLQAAAGAKLAHILVTHTHPIISRRRRG